MKRLARRRWHDQSHTTGEPTPLRRRDAPVQGPIADEPSDDEPRRPLESVAPTSLEAELLRLGRALHEANRELVALRERVRSEAADREEILTVVSHELRTPITVIT